MIKWYQDKNLGIFFGSIPEVSMRVVLPVMSETDKNTILKFPFFNDKKLDVELFDYKKNKKYSFSIPKAYVWDGATIPRAFWRLIGSKTDPKFLIPSLIHDVLCENHGYIDNDRYFSTLVFERLLYVSGVNGFSRWMIKHSVDNYQKFCGW